MGSLRGVRQLDREGHERNALVLSQAERIAALKSQLEALAPSAQEARRLSGELTEAWARMAQLEPRSPCTVRARPSALPLPLETPLGVQHFQVRIDGA